MDTLTPAEASPIAGVPVAQLLRWAWEGVGPKNSGTKTKPRYREQDVRAWRRKYGRMEVVNGLDHHSG